MRQNQDFTKNSIFLENLEAERMCTDAKNDDFPEILSFSLNFTNWKSEKFIEKMKITQIPDFGALELLSTSCTLIFSKICRTMFTEKITHFFLDTSQIRNLPDWTTQCTPSSSKCEVEFRFAHLYLELELHIWCGKSTDQYSCHTEYEPLTPSISGWTRHWFFRIFTHLTHILDRFCKVSLIMWLRIQDFRGFSGFVEDFERLYLRAPGELETRWGCVAKLRFCIFC